MEKKEMDNLLENKTFINNFMNELDLNELNRDEMRVLFDSLDFYKVNNIRMLSKKFDIWGLEFLCKKDAFDKEKLSTDAYGITLESKLEYFKKT